VSIFHEQETKPAKGEPMNKYWIPIFVLISALLTAPVIAQKKSRHRRIVQSNPPLIVVNNPTPSFHSGEVNVLVGR
jgi:hypothetical protein